MDLLPYISFSEVARTVLVLSLVTALGLAIGNVRLFNVNLGIAGVLFAGLLFGHFQITIPPEILEFAREFGLILFVYTVGLQVGPGFFSSLKREGLPLNLMAGSIVLLGAGVTLGIYFLSGIQLPTAVGLFSGATTNTPSLAAAQQALKDLPAFTEEAAKLPGLGYAVAYPFGILGIILTMMLVRTLFRVDVKKEAEAFIRQKMRTAEALHTLNIEVCNANLAGLPVKDIPALEGSGVVVSRVLNGGRVEVAQPDTVLSIGDVLLAVGPKQKLEQLRLVVGRASGVDLRDVESDITTRRILVTKKDALGKSIEELDLVRRYGVTVTRVSRSEVTFTAISGLRLKFADNLLVVGAAAAIDKVAAELGNSPKTLDHPQIIPVFVGIALGVILGSFPIYFPGIPAPVKLGLAGGPLVVALLLSRIGQIGPLVWYMPLSANFMLREVGIVLFLGCVGLKAGDKFFDTLFAGDGFLWMGLAALITLIPLLLVAFIGRMVYKLNYTSLCGLLAGSMTDPPALSFANAMTGSDAPSISYATVYPVTMLLRVLCAQAMVLLFFR